MSYAVALEPEANEALAALMPDVAEMAIDEIDRLAASPGSVEARSMPYDEPGMSFFSVRQFAGRSYQIQITFQFGQNEETLHILNIAVNPI